MLNLESVCKKILIFCLAVILTSLSLLSSVSVAYAQDKGREISLSEVKDWHQFKLRIEQQDHQDQVKGNAYMISGALLVVGGIVGYHNAHNAVEKLAYSVSQSLGVAGIGYGAYLSFVGSEQKAFYQSIENSKSLNDANKNELVRNYVDTWKENQRTERLTRIVTHSIVGALNIYNGSREEQSDLRQGLMILGGVNLLAALSLSFEF
jgi:CTP synthase (UTP-ammonia lyase)